MVHQNRQCFFFTENRIGKVATTIASLPWKDKRMYMNKMTVSEEDKFEICGFFSIDSGKWSNRNLRRFHNENKRKDIIAKLPAASGTVHLFTSGISLTKNFRCINVKGFNSFEKAFGDLQ